MKYLNINSINFEGSIVDGPGVRTVLFLQGCERRCKGCHNQTTWEKDKGKMYNLDELSNLLNDKCKNRKITITGGEPLLQEDSLIELLKMLEDFDITLYTGYDLEDVPTKILDYLDYIKVGPFIQELQTSTTPYVGSTNQKFIALNRRK